MKWATFSSSALWSRWFHGPGDQKRRLALRPWLWLLPAITLLLPFLIFPMAVLLRNSFYADDAVQRASLNNYILILTDRYYYDVFLNTVGIGIFIGILALLIAYPFSLFIVRWAGRWRPLLLWVVYTPLLVSVIVRVFGWIIITGDSGLINSALTWSGMIQQPIQLLYNINGMTIGMTHRYLPLMILPLVNSMSKIDGSLLQASTNLGASALRTQRKVIFPLVLPGAFAGFQLVFAGVLSDFILPNLMGTPRFRLLAPMLYEEAVVNLQWGNAAAMAVVMLLVVVIVLLLSHWIVGRLAPWSRNL